MVLSEVIGVASRILSLQEVSANAVVGYVSYFARMYLKLGGSVASLGAVR